MSEGHGNLSHQFTGTVGAAATSSRGWLGARMAVATMLIVAVHSGFAAEQSVAAAALSTDEPSSEGRLEEIIVSAQRREEKLDQVPISITALSQKSMDDLNIKSFQDLTTVVPGLAATTPGGLGQAAADVAIRGLYSGGNAPTTGIYIDETPISVRQLAAAGPSGSPRPDIFDLERVEVLRGPQGTLFGASAMGGAIRFITPQPNLNEASGYVKAEESFTERGDPSYVAGLAYGAPVIPGVAAFRLSGYYRSDGGFIDYEDPYTGSLVKPNNNNSNAYVFRPAFTYAPTEGLTITPAAFISHSHSNSSDGYWESDLPYQPAGKHATGAGGGPNVMTDDLRLYSLKITNDFAFATLQSDTSYLDRRSDTFDDWTSVLPGFFTGSTINLTPGLPSYHPYDRDIATTRMWQQEFRLTSRGESRVDWIAGAYFRHSIGAVAQVISDVNPLITALGGDAFTEYSYHGQMVGAYTAFSTTDVQTALFGQVGIQITSRLKGTVGLRVEQAVVKDQREIFAGPINGVNYVAFKLPDSTEHPITPRVNLSYQWTDDVMTYVTAAKGYRPGGANPPGLSTNPQCHDSVVAYGLSAVPESYNSDSVWSYELGTKFSMLDHRLSAQASAYYIDWKNVQTMANLPSCGSSFTLNSQKAVSKGFDLQVTAIPLPGLQISANVGYVDAYYPQTLRGAPLQDGSVPIIHARGDKLGVVPWTASVHGEYDWSGPFPWEGAKPYLRVDYRWLDRVANVNPLTANYDPALTSTVSDAYGLLNIRLGVVHEGLDISAFVNNATHADPILGRAHIGALTASTIRSFTAGVTGLYRF